MGLGRRRLGDRPRRRGAHGRDIAELLLERGARLDLFAAAMLGRVEIVRAILDAFPAMREAAGPHGIPLIEHARNGGEDAAAVVELLEGAAV